MMNLLLAKAVHHEARNGRLKQYTSILKGKGENTKSMTNNQIYRHKTTRFLSNQAPLTPKKQKITVRSPRKVIKSKPLIGSLRKKPIRRRRLVY